MKKLILTLGIMLSLIALTGCNLKNTPADTIIKVNDNPITKSQFDKTFDKYVGNSIYAQMGIDLRKSPDNYVYLTLKERVINELIIKELLNEEIKTRKIDVTKEDMEKEYATLIDKIGSKEKFNELLKQSKISQETMKNDLKEGIKIQKLVDTLGVVNVSDKDVQKYYKDNTALFKYPDKVKVSHILIAADPVQIKDVITGKAENKKLKPDEIAKKVQEELDIKKQKAEAILKELKLDPTKFAQLAKDNSDDTVSAIDGGNIGFVAKEEMQADFAKAAFEQKPNTISEQLVVTPYGYHIIMVTDRMKAGVEPFEKVKFDIQKYLEQQKKAELLQKFIENIKSKAKIEYVDADYNLDDVEKKIKEILQKNPSLLGEQSAKE